MISLFDKIKSIFFSTNDNKRKSNEPIEILRKNGNNQNNKENQLFEISIYNKNNFINDLTNHKLQNVDKSEILIVKKRKIELPLNEKNNVGAIIDKFDLKSINEKSSIKQLESKNKLVDAIFKRVKSSIEAMTRFSAYTYRLLGHCELSNFVKFTLKSHLLDHNLIEKITKPSIYVDSRQSQLKILQVESDVNCEQANKLERKYMEDITERFREIWSTDPTVLPRFEKRSSLPKVTDEMRDFILSKLGNKSRDAVVVEEFSLSVTVTDLYSLQSRQWLTDNVINFYLELINHRNNNDLKHPKIQILTSFFYTKLVSAGYNSVKRWTKRRPIFDSQLVLVPIHLGNHWCLVTIDLDNREVFYYDSLKSPNPRILTEMKNFLIADSKDKLNKLLNTDDWTFKQKYDGPLQNNGYDCGVFLCQTAEYTARRAKLDFKQEQMEYFRGKMSFEIIASKLL